MHFSFAVDQEMLGEIGGLWDIYPGWIPPTLWIATGAATVMVAVASAYFMIYGLGITRKGNMPPLPPGCMGMPFWGESLDYLKSWTNPNNPDVWYDTRNAKHGNIFATHILGSPTVVMLGADANKFIFTNENKLFRTSWNKSLTTLLGRNALVSSQGADHKRMWRIVHSFMGQEALKKAVGRFEGLILQHLDSQWYSGQIIRAHRQIKGMILRASAELFMGLKPGKELETFGRNFHDFSAGIVSHPLDLPWTTFGKAKRARAAMIARINVQMELQRSMEGDEQGNFIDIVLSAKKDGSNSVLNDDEIADNVLGLLTGSYDSTSSTLATILKHLALSPLVLQRLRKDCEKLRDCKKAGEPLTWSDIKSLDYLRNVISEGLRMVAPINGGFKETRTDVIYGGYTIPKGWKVHYSMRQTNNKEEYFPSPEIFNPGRFNERHEPFSFIPFGQGNRMCPGSEFAKLMMEVFLYHFVLRYDWELVEANEPIDMMGLSPSPLHGLPVILKPAPTSLAKS